MTIDEMWCYIDIDAPNGCWLWHGAFTPVFYGKVFAARNSHDLVHRIFFEYYLNFAPSVTMHRPLCPRNCCNPAHLTDGSTGSNLMEHSKHRYPRQGTQAAQDLRARLSSENREWMLKNRDRDHKAIRALAEDRLASELLSFGNNYEEEF